MKILAPIDELKDIISKEYADGKFLSALSVNGNNLQYTINGANKLVTVPYASKAATADVATYATNARITNTQPTAGTTYYPAFVSGIAANTNYPLRGNDTVAYRLSEGTASAEGVTGLWLGNNIAGGTAGNAYGYLRLYGTNTGNTDLRAKSQTGNYTQYLPTANGTLVYHTTGSAIGSTTAPVYVDSAGKVTACSASFLTTGNYATTLNSIYVKKAGDTMTGQLAFGGTTYPNIYGNGNYLILSAASDGLYGLTFDKVGTAIRARANNNTLLGTSSTRWSNIYSVLGNFSGQITSSVATGTAPFVVASTTEVANLHSATASKLHTARTIALSGAVTGTATSFDGSGNITIPTTSVNAPNVTGNMGTSSLYYGHHPEGFGGVMPFLYNDLAHLAQQGGSCTIYTTTDTDYTKPTLTNTGTIASNPSKPFDCAPDYLHYTVASTSTVVVIDIVCPVVFAYATKFYIDFGSGYWLAKDVSVYAWNNDSKNTSQVYTQKLSRVNVASMSSFGSFSYSYSDGTSTVQGFNRLRIVLTNFASLSPRIAQIGLVNYSSRGARIGYVSRGIDDVLYRNFTPAKDATYSLGTSAAKWNSVYASNFYGNIKFTTPRTLWGQSFDGSANVSGNLTSVGNITGSGQVLISSTGASNSIALRQNNTDATSVVLNSTAFKPYEVATNKLNLGTSSARWLGIYGNTLNLSGNAPILQFHYGNSTSVTSSISESASGTLSFGGYVNSKLLYCTTDATMKVYSLANSANTEYGTEMVAIQSCFDRADPETHNYVTQYKSRCNIILQPRGGQVYVGYTPTTLQKDYALNVGNKLRLYGADSGTIPEVLFYRNGVSSWKLVNNAGNFYFQNNYTTAVQSSYFNVLTLAYNTGNATLKGSFLPMTNNVSNLGSSSARWANAYLTNLNVSGTATITSVKIGDVTLSWDGTALKVDGTIYATGGMSSLGEGLEGGGGSAINVIDNLLSSSKTDALSANQGRVLDQNITAISSRVSSLSSSVSSLQTSTFTGKSSDEGYTLTWFTTSGGGRNVTIPTYDAISGNSISDYDGTPCLVSPFLIDDIQAWVTGRGYLTSSSLSGYLNTSNTSFTQKLTSGTEIGTIRIGGKDTKIYAPVASSGGNVDLSGYVTLNTQQTITGMKTFADTTDFNGDLCGYEDNAQTWDITTDGAARFTTVNGYTLAAACAKSFVDSSSASAIGTGTSLVTERDVYYGLPKINNVHSYNSNTNVYAPTAGGATNQYLKGNGTTAAPVWQTYSTSPTSGSTALITSGAVYTALANQKVTVTQTLTSGTAIGSIKVGSGSAVTLYAPSSSGSGGGANLSNVTQDITLANNPNDIDYGSYYLYFDAGLSNKAYIYAMPYHNETELHLYADALNVLAYTMYAYSIRCEDVTQTSDIRYKEVLEDMDIPLDKYASAPSFKFLWTDKKDGREHIGSSAQYWQSVDPLFVSENRKDGKLSLDYTMVSYTGVITVAKETEVLKERVNILEKENVELKERIELLECKLN